MKIVITILIHLIQKLNEKIRITVLSIVLIMLRCWPKNFNGNVNNINSLLQHFIMNYIWFVLTGVVSQKSFLFFIWILKNSKRKMVVALKNRDGALELSKCFPAHSAISQEMTTRGFDQFVTKSMQNLVWLTRDWNEISRSGTCDLETLWRVQKITEHRKGVAVRKRNRWKRSCVDRGL